MLSAQGTSRFEITQSRTFSDIAVHNSLIICWVEGSQCSQLCMVTDIGAERSSSFRSALALSLKDVLVSLSSEMVKFN